MVRVRVRVTVVVRAMVRLTAEVRVMVRVTVEVGGMKLWDGALTNLGVRLRTCLALQEGEGVGELGLHRRHALRQLKLTRLGG